MKLLIEILINIKFIFIHAYVCIAHNTTYSNNVYVYMFVCN